jgi:hypothetical protein
MIELAYIGIGLAVFFATYIYVVRDRLRKGKDRHVLMDDFGPALFAAILWPVALAGIAIYVVAKAIDKGMVALATRLEK